jgi:hypothetical protein
MRTIGQIIDAAPNPTTSGTKSGDTEPKGSEPTNDSGSGEADSISGYASFRPAYSADSGAGGGTGVGADSSGGDSPRRRGRPLGSKNKTESEKVQGGISIDLQGLLLSAHALVANMMEVPELQIDEMQARVYADAVKQASRHYVGAINPKYVDTMNLFCVMGSIYGPAFIAAKKRQSTKQPKAAQPQVVPIKQQPIQSGPKKVETPSEMWQEPG